MSDLDRSFHARGGDIYHLDPLCPVGRQLPPEWREAGTGGLALCPTCWARTKARQPSGPYVPPSPAPGHSGGGNQERRGGG